MLKKAFNTASEIIKEPAFYMTAAHMTLAQAVSGSAVMAASIGFGTVIAVKSIKGFDIHNSIGYAPVTAAVENENTSMRTAAAGLTAMSGLAFYKSGISIDPETILSFKDVGMAQLGTAFACFAGGNASFNTSLTKKIPFDNILYTTGSATTAYYAGGDLIPSAIIGAAGVLSLRNVLTTKDNKNLGCPRLFFAAAQTSAAGLGFAENGIGHLPSWALMSVSVGYTMMEARAQNWFGKDRHQPT